MRTHGIVLFLLSLSVLLAGCSGGGGESAVASQLKGKQAVLLVLQNDQDLNQLYFEYNGPRTDAPSGVSSTTTGFQDSATRERAQAAYKEAYDRVWNAGGTQEKATDAGTAAYNALIPNSVGSGAAGTGKVQIAELNLLLHNIGGSATIGGLFISGYDPNLIEVNSRLGQQPITHGNQRNCFKSLSIGVTGQYDVEYACEPLQGQLGYGGQVLDRDGDGEPDQIIGSVFNLDALADKIGGVFGEDTDFFTKNGIFGTGSRLDCGITDGTLGSFKCGFRFNGGVNYDPNRASHGFLLINLVGYGDAQDCPNECRKFPDKAPIEVLEGVSDTNPDGGFMYADYDVFLDRAKWNPLVNEMKQTFQITACYLYTTTVTPAVCVDPTPNDNRNEACVAGPIDFRDSQGAPIQVTRIEQQSQPGATAFTIYVQHIGSGQVWLPGAFDQCSPYSPARLDRRKQDAVVLLDARVSGDLTQLRCLPESNQNQRIIRLENGRGKITCLYPINPYGPNAAYTSSLSLEFGYLYENTIRKDVIIHRT